MRILLATDGSEFSRAAAEKCCTVIPQPDKTEVMVVSVCQQVVPLDTFVESVEYAQEQERAERHKAENQVADAAAVIRECFADLGIIVTTQVLIGAADREILRVAEEWQPDFMVVGSHGRGYWGRTIVGSITDSLVHHAPCSVFVVRTIRSKKKSL